MSITIAFFAANSCKGQELKEEFGKIAGTLYKFDVKVYDNAAPQQFLKACMYDDLVIFDASVEDEKGENYFAATENLKSMKHVLVVSRTYLPVNFGGIISGGYPLYPNQFTNSQIINWLKDIIEKKFINILPRADKGYLKSLKLMKSSVEFGEKMNNEQGKIFISYRNSDDNYGKAKELKRKLENGVYHQGERKTVRLIDPGTFINEGELLPEWRHWHGLSIIERWISAADEFYICYSHDYLDSWWTVGEIMSLVYTSTPNKLRIYDPDTEKVYDDHPLIQDIKKLSMDASQKKRMARWFANCDPLTMGPESVKAIGGYQHMPIIKNSRYINDRVFQPEFWDSNILHCSKCFESEYKNNINNLDIDRFLWLSDTFSNIFLAPEQFQKAIENKLIKCPKCGKEYHIISKSPRYLWMPTRFGKATGNNNSNLTTINTYVAL